MKRIKAVNGYTIYEATANDEKKYNVEAGYFYLYFSSDIRDYGISCCDPDYEAGSLEEAISFATGTNYAVAKEIVEETTTAATFEEIAEIEKLLDAGATPATIAAAPVLEDVIKDAMQLCYDSTSMALDIICERLFYDHGIDATFSGRSVYIGDRRAASIKTSAEPSDAGKIICIYDYTMLI
jgi:hypothetical protein